MRSLKDAAIEVWEELVGRSIIEDR